VEKLKAVCEAAPVKGIGEEVELPCCTGVADGANVEVDFVVVVETAVVPAA